MTTVAPPPTTEKATEKVIPKKSNNPTPSPQPITAPKSNYYPNRGNIVRIHKPPEKEENKSETRAISYGSMAFTYDDLLKHWNEYAKIVEAREGGFASSILTKNKPELSAENVINQVIDNETGLLKFNRLSGALLNYLKEHLQNDSITITTEINKQKTAKSLYTNKDKFEHLLKENPELKEWVKRFKLDIDV